MMSSSVRVIVTMLRFAISKRCTKYIGRNVRFVVTTTLHMRARHGVTRNHRSPLSQCGSACNRCPCVA